MRPVHKADNLNHHPGPLSRNLGTLTSWNPLGHYRPVMGLIYLLVIHIVNMRNLKNFYTVFVCV